MTREEWREKLDGRNYPFKLTRDEQKALKDDDLVVVCGQSDDIMAFYGAISDEVYAFEGGTAYLNKDGILQNECPECDCPYFKREMEKSVVLKQRWLGDYSIQIWVYETIIQRLEFNVMEDGEVYCQAIVFALSDIPDVLNDARN